jgi:hypothetical protein
LFVVGEGQCLQQNHIYILGFEIGDHLPLPSDVFVTRQLGSIRFKLLNKEARDKIGVDHLPLPSDVVVTHQLGNDTVIQIVE